MRVWIVVVALLSAVFASANPVLVIHHFDDGGDYGTGTVMADSIAAAFDTDDHTVFGPDAIHSALPPVWVPSGFVSLTRMMNVEDYFSVSGAQLFRGALDADLAVSGTLTQSDSTMTLSLVLATPERTYVRTLTAEAGDYDQLVGTAVATIAQYGFTPQYDRVYSVNDHLETGLHIPLLFAMVNANGAGAKQFAADILRTLEWEGYEMDPRVALRSATLAYAVLGEGTTVTDTLRYLFVELNTGESSDSELADQFAELGRHDVRAAELWSGLLYISGNKDSLATRMLTRFDVHYPYARQIARNWMFHNSDKSVDTWTLIDWYGPFDRLDAAGAFATSVMAFDIGNTAFEAEIAEVLMSKAPFLAWGFEQRSFAALDLDDPLASAAALAVAVELQPDSALYWTNLGWSYYLLGWYEQSIAASQTATELPDLAESEIPYYNLGLAHVVLDDIESAYDAYIRALGVAPGVHPASFEDLLVARTRAPESASVAFFTAFLAQEDGQRDVAAEEFERFLSFDRSGTTWQPYQSYAEERLVALNAPPGEIVIEPDFELRLGTRGPVANAFHPGDAVSPVFELTTPDYELPRFVQIALEVQSDGDVAYDVIYDGDYEIPEGAVGYVIDELSFTLDPTLPNGDYEIELIVSSDAGQEARAMRTLEIVGEYNVHRVLFSNRVQFTAIQTGQVLNTERALGNEDSLMRAYMAELRLVQAEAASVIPEITEGRFVGLDGGEAFGQSTESDVLDFLSWIAASGEIAEFIAMFVDLYADWILTGAP